MDSVLSCLYFTDGSKHYRTECNNSTRPEMENLVHLTNHEAESE